MKFLAVFIVAICHIALFFTLWDAENDLLMADFSSEGLTELNHEDYTFTPKYTHQDKEYVITVDLNIKSDWSFPTFIEPVKSPEPITEIITPKAIEQIPAIKPPKPIIPDTQKKIAETSKKTDPKKIVNNKQKSQQGTGAGHRNAVGKGSGTNITDGPAGFANGNSDQTILQNIQRCYPRISRQRGEQGVAIIRIHVDQNGKVIRKELIQSTNFSRLDKCALESVQAMNVKPKIMNGRKTSGYFDQSIRFRLN